MFSLIDSSIFKQSAVGWDYQEKVEKHESQKDYVKGFGGKFGLQTDRVDKAAVGFDADQGPVGTTYDKQKPVVAGKCFSLLSKLQWKTSIVTEKGKASLLKSRFENLAEENKKAAQTSPPAKTVRPVAKITQKFEPTPQAPAPRSPSPVKPEPVAEPKVIPQQQEPVRQEEPQPEHVTPEHQPPAPQPAHNNHATWNLAETIEEVDDDAWKEEQVSAWQHQETGTYIQESSNLETVDEENGTGLTAIALYDYQAAAEDELTFDPDEIITNIEMVLSFILNVNMPLIFDFSLDWRRLVARRVQRHGRTLPGQLRTTSTMKQNKGLPSGF